MILSRLLKQTLVYWAPGSIDGYGNSAFAAAVEIACRWEDVETIFVDSNGENDAASSRVYIAGTVSVALDGRMYLGLLNDLSAPEQLDPSGIEGVLRLVSAGDTPSLKADQSLQTVLLK